MVTGWVQIMKVTRDTIGTYVCNARNSQGADKATAAITYFEKGEQSFLNVVNVTHVKLGFPREWNLINSTQ